MGSEKRTPGSVVKALIGFIGMSAVVGVLVAVTVTPSVAVAGVATNETIGLFENLPEYLEVDKLSEKSNIYATNSDGSPILLASFYDQNRVEVPWDQVSQYAKDAAIAGEDPRFYEHGGIDLQGTLRAIVKTYVVGGGTQGGSSITQQYVKNVLVQKAVQTAKTQEEQDAAIEAAIQTTEARKVREMKLAVGLEKKYTKDQILLGYLNIAPFGGTVYGIESAANYYFGVSAANLDIPQSAALLAIVNNPANLRLDQPDNEENGAANGYARTLDRRNYILNKMFEEKKITADELAAAGATPILPVITEPSVGCSTAAGSGYFCDYVTQIFRNDPIFGADEDTRWLNFKRGGLDVYTTLDVDLQRAAENAINEQVPQTMAGFDVGSVAVSVQVGTGRVLAMAQNKTYSQDPSVLDTNPAATAINYNTDEAYGGSGGIPPGSTYKLFTLLEWLKEGHSLNEGVNAQRRANWGAFPDSCSDGGTTYADAGWNPNNDGGEGGGFWTAQQNTVNSYNTGFIAMAKQLDQCGISGTAEAMGVHRADGAPLERYPSVVLGTNEVAPISMAGAFAAVAANGTVCNPIAIDKIVDASGAELPVPAANCRVGVEPNIAATAAIALQATFAGGTTTSSRVGDGIPLIGKTGTTDNNEDTWMSGASTSVATTVGVFNVTGHTNQRQTWFPSGRAAEARHRIWPQIMEVANDKYGGQAFAKADSSLQTVVEVTIPDVRGLTLADATDRLEAAGFEVIDGGQEDSSLPVGQVNSTSPTGKAQKGSPITVKTSNGSQKLIPDVLGKTLDDAKSAFAAAGIASITLQCRTDASAPDGGSVTTQDPAAGAAVGADQKITIQVQQKKC